MADQDLTRLQHMRDSTSAILSFIKGKNRESLDSDRLLLSGIIRELEIIGEAAGSLVKEPEGLQLKTSLGQRPRLSMI